MELEAKRRSTHLENHSKSSLKVELQNLHFNLQMHDNQTFSIVLFNWDIFGDFALLWRQQQQFENLNGFASNYR